MLKITKRRSGDQYNVWIKGDMTIYHAEEGKGRLLAILKDGKDVQIDLSGVAELDTAGFQLLLLAKQHSADKGYGVTLVSHSAAVVEVMDLYNMGAWFGDPVVLSDH